MAVPRDAVAIPSKEYDAEAAELHTSERESLLSAQDGLHTSFPTTPDVLAMSTGSQIFTLRHLISSFVAGVVLCFAVQLGIFGKACYSFMESAVATSGSRGGEANVYAPPYVGSTQVHNYPPPSPTNNYPEMFPTNVGYPGGTPTGAEPALIVTAPSQPLHTGAAQLVAPAYASLPKDSNTPTPPGERPFNLFRSWGNLSPWYSVPQGAFGINEDPEPPSGCELTGVHVLHRHGARYPTAWANYGGPAILATRLHESAEEWEASGSLSFLNGWTYKLGEEVLTPFGRQQLYDLGVSMRLKYGFLLENFTASDRLPVFRTESQDRMHASAVNFALGFFGWPIEGKYEQVLMIEAEGFNNTLAPYDTCPNAKTHGKADRSLSYVRRWSSIYLNEAKERLQAELLPAESGKKGFELSIEDVYRMQQMCAYETVALGYSKFCELFTEEEWEGFNYAMDLSFWYDSAFGSPVARVQGVGYVQELISRLTHTPIEIHNSSTNATFHASEVTWPLEDVLYVDATHEVVVLNVLTALNLTTLAASGPLPADHIPANRSFRVSDIAPFATNMQFQLLSCPALTDGDPHPPPSSDSTTHIRIILNDGPVPLTGIKGCPHSLHGLCPLPVFIQAQQEMIGETDWEWGCHGSWEVPEGGEWETVGGWYPARVGG
ncbi:phosphoglycerate mutase-like protein [Phlebopus sp. FC_14]|nr:phosphoglycerate mutase-like protein [Phlebopus sp. FC_14]